MIKRTPTTSIFLTLFVLGTSGPALSQSEPELIITSDTGDSLEIPLSSDSTIAINPETGDLKVTEADTSNVGGSADVAVDAFTPDPATVEQGKSFKVNLNSVGAWECRRTGLSGTSWNLGWTNPPPEGTLSVSVDTSIAPAIYTLAYECRNGGVTKSKEADLEVVEAPEPDADLPAECSDVPLPGNWSRDTTAMANDLTTTTEFWSDVFGNEFPAGASENIAINEDQYMVLEFDPSNLPAGTNGNITFDKFSGSGSSGDTGNGTPTATISRCPGDFRPQQDAKCRRVDQTIMAWTTDSNSGDCSLDTSVSRYFFNVVYAREVEEDDPSTWTYWCPDIFNEDRTHFPECGSLLSNSSNL